jgi:hypothetical protein
MPIAMALCLTVSAGQNSFSQGPKKAEPPASKLILLQHVEVLGDSAREPAIAQHPNGTLFVSGYGALAGGRPQQVPTVWKSSDRGESWTPVDVGSTVDGASGNSDVSLSIAQDGTVYLVELEFDPKIMAGIRVTVGVSRDVGRTWRWTTLAREHWEDRPWVAVAPDGTAHVIWNDSEGVQHTMSRDFGTTWSAPQCLNHMGGSSHLAVGPHGNVAVRIVPSYAGGSRFSAGADFVVVSTDGGSTWRKRRPPGDQDWSPGDTPGSTPRWVEPLAWDGKGALYSLWTNRKGVWLAQSTDDAVTWRQWRVADIDALSYYPYLTAKGRGELAATWFSGTGESLQWHLARIEIGKFPARPRVAERSELRTDSWARTTDSGATLRETAGEYLSVLFLSNGDIAVVSPIQHLQIKRLGFSFWRFR